MSIPLTYTRRPLRQWMREFILDDSVRGFVWIFYISFFVWGAWGTFYAYPVDLIVRPMGVAVYDAWVWMPLLSMPTALGGLVLRHGGSPAEDIKGPLLRRDFLGLWMQVGGHGAMAITLAVYIGAAIIGAEHRQPIVSVFVFVPYLISVVILGWQCIYKIKLGKAFR